MSAGGFVFFACVSIVFHSFCRKTRSRSTSSALAPQLRAHDLVHVEEAVLLEADLDECGLHPRQDVVDGAEIDVAGDRAALWSLEVHLRDLVVLEHRDALLADVEGDQELALCLREGARLRDLAPAPLLLRALALARLRLSFGLLLLGLGFGRSG